MLGHWKVECSSFHLVALNFCSTLLRPLPLTAFAKSLAWALDGFSLLSTKLVHEPGPLGEKVERYLRTMTAWWCWLMLAWVRISVFLILPPGLPSRRWCSGAWRGSPAARTGTTGTPTSGWRSRVPSTSSMTRFDTCWLVLKLLA